MVPDPSLSMSEIIFLISSFLGSNPRARIATFNSLASIVPAKRKQRWSQTRPCQNVDGISTYQSHQYRKDQKPHGFLAFVLPSIQTFCSLMPLSFRKKKTCRKKRSNLEICVVEEAKLKNETPVVYFPVLWNKHKTKQPTSQLRPFLIKGGGSDHINGVMSEAHKDDNELKTSLFNEKRKEGGKFIYL